MAIEDIVERATIRFEMPLMIKQVEEMFQYFRNEQNLVTTYRVTLQKNLGNLFEEASFGEEPKISGVSINGNFNDPKTYANDYFECKKTIGDDEEPYLNGFKFNVVPGWKLSEYRPEILQLWDDIRGLTAKYFQEKY